MTQSKEPNGLKTILISAASMIVATIVVQSGVFLYWAGKMDVRMTHAESDLTRLCLRMDKLEDQK